MVGVKRVGYDDFAGFDAGDLRGNCRPVAFPDAEFSGRDIDPGESEAVLVRGSAGARQCQQVVVAAGIEECILRQGSGRHQAHDVATNDTLGTALSRFGGVLKLLAHRDAVAERDQAMQIFIGALDRNAAHGNVAAEMLAALGQYDPERAGGDFGVLKEQLIKITHPVEQKTIRIGSLDLDILLHHGRDAPGFIGRFRRQAPDIFGRVPGCSSAFRRSSGTVRLDWACDVHGVGR